MIIKKDHISVCICTYKRKKLLNNLLIVLQNQKTNDMFDYSVLVVDNDREISAKSVVDEIKNNSTIIISYYSEPEQNIAIARNRAVECAKGDYLAFIDDDEFPVDTWLLDMYVMCNKLDVDGVLGPVLPLFNVDPPDWVIKGKFFERPTHKTGTILSWKNTRTGNVLIRKYVFDNKENRFNKIFLSSEDKEFFYRMIKKGYVFVWCNEAYVYETVDPARWKKTFMIKRALFRGKMASMYPDSGTFDVLKSIIAVLFYTICLPIFYFMGKQVFIKYIIKVCDHIGKLLAFCRIDVIGNQRP